ncbi:MAG TPA: hypothetical protein VND93_23640 [Myxococcales bacterium]|jgi:hypothetical protein|nr:hypothetical protein [Myxococcales bacterium]
MRRFAAVLLLAAGLTGLPASAQNYCAAVVDNDPVQPLKSNILKVLRRVTTPDRNVGGWPGSTTGMMEVGADQGTMKMKENFYRNSPGLALHATLCSSDRRGVSCATARQFFERAGANNHLKRHGDQDDTSFRYVDLEDAYKEVLRGWDFKLRPSGFEYQQWGSWYALPLGDARPLYGSTTGRSGTKTNQALSGALHVSFIKVNFDDKESTNARRVSQALEEALSGESDITLRFTQVKCY